MTELFTEAIKWQNMPLTIILGAMAIYWAAVLFGAISSEALDIDLDMDADGDAEAGGETGGFLFGIMKFFSLGDVPLMIILTIKSLSMWCSSVLLNYFWNANGATGLAICFLILSIFIAVIVTKVLSMPIAKFFKAFNKDYNEVGDLIGRVCKVRSLTVDETFGQAECEHKMGAPVTLNVRTREGSESLEQGDAALIYDRDKEKDFYFVKKVTKEDFE